MKARFGRRAARRGQSLAEFALALPILFILTLGVIDGGRLVFCLGTLDYAVEEAARYAGLPSTTSTSEVQAYVSTHAYFMDVPSSSVSVVVNDGATAYGSRASGDRVAVSATYIYSPIVTSMFGVPFNATLSARRDVRAE
jgi:Flp pilus assembly protein TadG